MESLEEYANEIRYLDSSQRGYAAMRLVDSYYDGNISLVEFLAKMNILTMVCVS